MNRSHRTSAAAGGVVIGYRGTGLAVDSGRNSIAKRKGGYPGFRIRMASFYVESVHAIVKCIGWDVQHFVSQAILSAVHEAAREIGVDPPDIAKLSDRQRAEICRKYRSVAGVTRKIYPDLN
jgi:hypothetical protein